MKTKLIALALAAGVVAGSAGIASTASAAPATAVTPAVSVHVDLGGLVGFHFGGHHRYGYRHRRFCRRMFVLGFRYGNPRARYLWRRHCRRYYY